MTPLKLSYAARNAIIFFRDAATKKIPEITRQGTVWSISTCIAAGCLPDCDGSTSIIIASGEDAPKTNHLVFEGVVDFPSGFAAIDTVLDDVILEFPLSAGSHRIRLWNDGGPTSELLVFGID